MNRYNTIAGLALALFCLAGCDPALQKAGPVSETKICPVTDTTPAMIETETVQIIEEPAVLAEDGTVVTPPVYRTESRPKILKDRKEIEFDAVCPEDLDGEFVATLQRALRARGYLTTPTTGVMDAETRRAVRGYQINLGLNSDTLSIKAARELGLVV
ncbi:MAG: peptidoglycan-binding domain-containing protein [Marinosulfonomonas sp.]